MPGAEGQRLVDDLIAQAAVDTDQGLEEYSDKLERLRQRLIDRMEDADAEREQGNAEPVRTVRRAEGPADPVGSEGLHGVRRVAADPGPARDAAPCHIMTTTAVLAVPTGDLDLEPIFVAQWALWACGPCKRQGGARTETERNQQVADHVEARRCRIDWTTWSAA